MDNNYKVKLFFIQPIQNNGRTLSIYTCSYSFHGVEKNGKKVKLKTEKETREKLIAGGDRDLCCIFAAASAKYLLFFLTARLFFLKNMEFFLCCFTYKRQKHATQNNASLAMNLIYFNLWTTKRLKGLNSCWSVILRHTLYSSIVTTAYDSCFMDERDLFISHINKTISLEYISAMNNGESHRNEVLITFGSDEQ